MHRSPHRGSSFHFVVRIQRVAHDVGEALDGLRAALNSAADDELRRSLFLRQDQFRNSCEALKAGFGDRLNQVDLRLCAASIRRSRRPAPHSKAAPVRRSRGQDIEAGNRTRTLG
jgi:hypothetical protein